MMVWRSVSHVVIAWLPVGARLAALAVELTEASSLQHIAIMLTRLLPLPRRNRKDLYIIQQAVLAERF